MRLVWAFIAVLVAAAAVAVFAPELGGGEGRAAHDPSESPAPRDSATDDPMPVAAARSDRSEPVPPAVTLTPPTGPEPGAREAGSSSGGPGTEPVASTGGSPPVVAAPESPAAAEATLAIAMESKEPGEAPGGLAHPSEGEGEATPTTTGDRPAAIEPAIATPTAEEGTQEEPREQPRESPQELPQEEKLQEPSIDVAAPLPAGEGPALAPAPQDEPAPPPGALAGEPPIPAKFETREDGSVLVDDRFVIRGEGTKEKPYLITWDQLVSAQETYLPKQGRKRLPERVTMLNGKWVEISGNISYPLLEEEPRELLMMLNPWDGCCIGVPPTPYDAVEVQLTGVLRDDRRFATIGSVRGRFKVDPYLAGEWLIGLYLMEGAELIVAPGAGAGF